MASPATSARDLLVALNAAPRLSRASICRLAAELDAWYPMPRRAPESLATALGLPLRPLRRALRLITSAAERAAEERQLASRLGARILTRLDSGYPPQLLQLTLPPPVLYLRGALPDRPAIAIVGSRLPDAYGREAAAFFARQLARSGVAVVSGFARGIDVAAHRGALAAPGGLTVAVLGCGIDIPYPAAHADLAHRIAGGAGAVVSEFPPGTPPRKENFPIRNRIIAALGAATLVVQATPRSGSLITARHALELGREVFALPGRIFDETALGTNALLRDGCRVALHPADLVEEALGPSAAGAGRSETIGAEGCDPPPPLPGAGPRLWRLLAACRTLGVEELASALAQPPQEILGLLLELELAGWVERLPGPAYRRKGAWGR
jgi:DNA processing protein